MSKANFWRDHKLNEVSQGRAAEHFVAYILESNGLKTSFALQSGFDLMAFSAESTFKVQVKSTSMPQADRQNRAGFRIGKHDHLSDVFAFVYLPRQTVIFEKTSEIKHLQKWNRPLTLFTEENMMSTLMECFNGAHGSG
jgi:hypothetical protein